MDSGLLAQIQEGKSLKKAHTNDRSAPLVSGGPTVTNARSSNSNQPPPSKSHSVDNATPMAPQLAGLFSQGMPTLRKTKGAAVSTGRQSNNVPSPPSAARPSNTTSTLPRSFKAPPPIPGRGTPPTHFAVPPPSINKNASIPASSVVNNTSIPHPPPPPPAVSSGSIPHPPSPPPAVNSGSIPHPPPPPPAVNIGSIPHPPPPPPAVNSGSFYQSPQHINKNASIPVPPPPPPPIGSNAISANHLSSLAPPLPGRTRSNSSPQRPIPPPPSRNIINLTTTTPPLPSVHPSSAFTHNNQRSPTKGLAAPPPLPPGRPRSSSATHQLSSIPVPPPTAPSAPSYSPVYRGKATNTPPRSPLPPPPPPSKQPNDCTTEGNGRFHFRPISALPAPRHFQSNRHEYQSGSSRGNAYPLDTTKLYG